MSDDIKSKDLSFREVFSIGFKIYSLNIKTIVALAILVYIPVALLGLLIIEPQMYNFLMVLETYMGVYNIGQMINIIMNIGNLPVEIASTITRILYMIMAAMVISSALFVPILSSGSTFLVQGFAKDEQISTDDTVTTALANILKTFVTALLSFSFIMLGLIFVLPGIYMSVIFAFAIPAVIMSGRWGFGALAESFSVVRGRWFKVLGLIVITSIFAPIILQEMASLIAISVYLIMPNEIIVDAVGGIVSNIMLTYLIMVECLWFVNKYLIKTNIRNLDITA